MGVLQYMQQGGPSFISYRRTPDRKVSPPAVKEKPAYKGTEFDLDMLANPGDKQWLYDQQTQFNNTMGALFNEYGGEGPFMKEDPRYKEAIANYRYAIYDAQAGRQNYDRGVERHRQLSTPDSGQNPYDFELTRQGSVLLPQLGPKGYLQKKEFLQDVIANPRTIVRPDGTVGLEHVEYDQGRGSEKSTNETFDKILSGDSRIGINSGGSSEITGNETGYTKGLKYSVGWLHEEGSKWSNNYEGLQEAIDYVTKYGFDDETEYFLWQSMWDDVEEGRPIYRPAMDESGKIQYDKNNEVIMEAYEVNPETVKKAKEGDLDALLEVEGLYTDYVSNRFIEYADKFKKRHAETTYRHTTTREGYDPVTGEKVEDEKPKYWYELATDDNFTGQTKGQTNRQYVQNADGKWVIQEVGKDANGNDVNVTNLRYEDRSTAPTFFEQADANLVNENIADISSNIDWDPTNQTKMMLVGNTWQPIPEGLEDAQIDQVIGYEEIIAPNGQIIHGTRVRILGDDDNTAMRNLKFYDEREKKEKNVLYFDWGWGSDINQYEIDPEIEGRGIKWMSRDELSEEQVNRVHQNEGTNIWDADDHYVYSMEVVIPTSKVATTQHDMWEFGMTQRVKQGEKVTEGIQQTNKAQIDQQENVKKLSTVNK